MSKDEVDRYMGLKYPVLLEVIEEDGESLFGLKVPDLPGVWASGKTLEEAYRELMESKRLWFKTCIENGIDIPLPAHEERYSGKFVLRPGAALHMRLSQRAKHKKISLNQYVKGLLKNQIEWADLLEAVGNANRNLLSMLQKLEKEIASLRMRVDSMEESFSSVGNQVQRWDIYSVPVEPWNRSGVSVVTYGSGDYTAYAPLASEKDMQITYVAESPTVNWRFVEEEEAGRH
ncbi:MAG: toxin-antitoxin system HicB family antitoxin [Thermodesulfobacteriota bacterium]